MPFEGVYRLGHQRHAIGKKEHALGPIAAHQQIAERDDGACFAGPGRHHHQRLAIMVPLEDLADPANGADLIRALDDRSIDLRVRQLLAARAPLDHQFQLRFFVEALHLARRVAGIVPHPVLIAVRVKDHGPPAELLLQTIGVQLGLLLAEMRAFMGALGLDQSERLAVVAPEHVIHETAAGHVRHPAHFVFAVAR